MDLYREFEWRGMIFEATEGLAELLAVEKVVAYIGFDPTAPSLHVGSLLPVMALARLQRFGHTPIAIVGGGTGLIGDPSGKTQERALLNRDEVRAHLDGIRGQLERFLDFDTVRPNRARIVDNADWLAGLNLMDFLRDVGKHFTIRNMLAKESVRRRLDQEEGISFTEFSYQLLQAYDFLRLHDEYGCTLQLGGSDQWGNITAGCELIRRLRRGRAFGLVLPLVTTASGAKFGKTEAGAVWLDAEQTSPFRFYQFWLNTDDRDALVYLKYFTFLTEGEIRDLEAALGRAPEKREVQRVLAREVTRLVHGEDALGRAERASSLLFSEGISALNVQDVVDMVGDVPATELARGRLEGAGVPIVELLTEVRLAPSRSEATRLIRGGGIYVNNRRVAEERARVTLAEAIGGQVLLLRKGQRENHLVKVREDAG